MAKNEIKMLLLGAGESGKVRRSPLIQPISTLFFFAVDGPETDEAHTSWRV